MGRILVIEDNPTNLELVTYLLSAFGHAAVPARDGEAGIEAALASKPDLILCDLAMPKLDGYAVARRLKSDPSTKSIPLVAVTASAMVGDKDKVYASGFDGYIRKPIDPETFVGEVEAFLRGGEVAWRPS
jgi:CheY-like chemotaxis protein